MPMELQIIRASEFIRLGPRGHFDLKASKAVLAQLARACCQRGIRRALLDLRALHPGPRPVFSPNDLVMLVSTFRQAGFTRQQRLAVLYGSDPHHRARLFAFIAKLRGWSVQAFDDYEQAVLWLSHTDEAPGEIEPTPQPRPVAVRLAKPASASSKFNIPAGPVIPIKTRPQPVRIGTRGQPAASNRTARMKSALMIVMTFFPAVVPVLKTLVAPMLPAGPV